MTAPGWLQDKLAGLLQGIDIRPESMAGIVEDGITPGCRFAAGEAAAVVLAGVGVLAADLWKRRGGMDQEVAVSTRRAAASLRSFLVQTVDGKPERSTPVDNSPMAGMYETRDGGYFYVCNPFPHLVARGLDALGLRDSTLEGVRAAIAQRDGAELEEAMARAQASGAMVRTAEQWDAHPQGQAVAAAGPLEIIRIGDAPPEPLKPVAAERPLQGVRVLDLTRILAGPTCARTLAEHGADVLHVSSRHLDSVRSFVIDTGPGKRAANLNLESADDSMILAALVRGADVFSQGFRSGALARRGFGPEELARLRPGIIYVSTNCYGHAGPWEGRRGFDQLASSVTGIAMRQGERAGRPQLLPNVANDYITGYLGALGVLAALHRRAREGGSWHVQVSLCQTAMWLRDFAPMRDIEASPQFDPWPGDFVESPTPYGLLRHLSPVVSMSGTPARWELPSVPLGTHPAQWLAR